MSFDDLDPEDAAVGTAAGVAARARNSDDDHDDSDNTDGVGGEMSYGQALAWGIGGLAAFAGTLVWIFSVAGTPPKQAPKVQPEPSANTLELNQR
ncbi:MAG TPA: hypothetical protein PLO23_05035 [Alphaproteobacteria bacterium]|nr:hypothetical protein [Alphaproteobacteria bacterium]